MDREALNRQLRQLNTFERELKSLDPKSVKHRFSDSDVEEQWRINNAKIMTEDEDIAIHKHDRFISFEKHSHDYIEMMFIYSGEIVHHVEGKEIHQNAGELLLFDMNVEHSIEAAGEEDIAVNILIKKEFFDAFFLKQIAYNDVITSFVINAIYDQSGERQYMYFHTQGDQVIWDLCLNILSEFYDRRNGMETAIKGYMLLLFNELFRDYQKYLTRRVVEKIDNAIILDIRSYIEENYKTLSLKSMASHFNYNSDYLGKQIKKLTGMNLRDWVKDKKLEEAARLLRHTKMSMLEILEEVNYSNMSYFYKQFKHKYEETPDEYRKKNN